MAIKVCGITVVDNTQAANVKSLTVSGGTITAGGATGTSGQVLCSTGTGVAWATPASGAPTLNAQCSLGIGVGSGNSLVSNTTGNSNFAVGVLTMYCNTTGSNNTAIGNQAMRFSLGGDNNTAIGFCSLMNNTTGSSNIAIGYQTLQNNSGGTDNYALGCQALYSNATGYSNIAIGCKTLCLNTSYYNIALGANVLQNNTLGYGNIGLGALSLYCNTLGRKNVAVGCRTMMQNTTGNLNSAIGPSALYLNTTGVGNVAQGYQSLYCNTAGGCNVGIGYAAGLNIRTGGYNVALGPSALLNTYTGTCNIGIGTGAGLSINGGSNNTIIGGSGPADGSNQLWLQAGTNCLVVSSAGSLTLNGAAVGGGGGGAAMTGTSNFVVGSPRNTGTCNIAIGCYNMCATTALTNRNIAIGSCNSTVMTNACDNIIIGHCVFWSQTTGSCNTVIGNGTASSMGGSSFQNVVMGNNNYFCGIGHQHTSIGYGAGQRQTGNTYGSTWIGNQAGLNSNGAPGSGSTMVGYAAGGGGGSYYNTAVGAQAGNNMMGYYNVILGYGTYYAAYGSYCNNVMVGANTGQRVCGGGNILLGACIEYRIGGTSTQSNNIIIGQCACAPTNTSCNSITIGATTYTCQRAPSATWSALSDCRDKTCIQPIVAGLDFIKQVKPVKFNWKIRNSTEAHPRWMMPDSGFIAQDLLELLNDFSTAQGYDAKAFLKTANDENPEEYVADPGKLVPILVKAVQELATANESLAARVTALETKLNTP